MPGCAKRKHSLFVEMNDVSHVFIKASRIIQIIDFFSLNQCNKMDTLTLQAPEVNHWWPVASPHIWPVMRTPFPCHGVIIGIDLRTDSTYLLSTVTYDWVSRKCYIKLCRRTCLVGLLIRSIFRGKNCTSASARVQFFQLKIERVNRPTRHVLL